MTMDAEHNDLIGMADIARMVGVSRATVGNWKARQPDEFPPERGRTARGPLYDPTEVASWLATRRTQRPTVPAGRGGSTEVHEDLWRTVEALRRTWRLADAAPVLLYALCRSIAETNGRLEVLTAKVDALDPELRPALERLRQDAPDELGALIATAQQAEDPLELVWDASNLLANVGKYWDFGTPAPVADLIAGLVGPAESIYDPAIGTGQLAARTARTGGRNVQVFGQDLNPAAGALATGLLEAAGIDSYVKQGDAIALDEHPGLLADVVVSHPPFGLRFSSEVADPKDIRWRFGLPRGDTAWLQIGLHHLAPNGRMAIVASPNLLFRHGVEGQILELIVRQGLLRAVIALPERSLAPAAISPVVLLLGNGWDTPSSPTDTSILMVDHAEFRNPDADRRAGLTPESIGKVTEFVRSWLETGHEPESHTANVVTYDQIVANDWVLLPHRYVPSTNPTGPTIQTLDSDEILDENRELLTKWMTDLSEQVTWYIDQDYRHTPTTGVATTLGALDGVDIISGVASYDVTNEIVGGVAAIEPEDLQGVPAFTSFWLGDNGVLLKPGDVLIKVISPKLGDSAQLRDDSELGDCVAAPGVAVVRTGELSTVTADYLAAWCASPAFRREMGRLAVGSVRKRVRVEDLAAAAIVVPDTETQQMLGQRAKGVANIERLLVELTASVEQFASDELSDLTRSIEPREPHDQ